MARKPRSRCKTASRIAAALALVLLFAAAPAQAATEVARGHTPDAVTDREGVTHLVWSEYRRQRPNQNSLQRVDIVHYCKIPRGSASCTGEKTFSECVIPEDQLPDAPLRTGVDEWGPHVMISSFGEVVITTTRWCRYFEQDDPPDAYRERIETRAFFSEDDGDTFTALGRIGNLPAGGGYGTGPQWTTSTDPIAMNTARPLFDAADRRVVMPYAGVGGFDPAGQGAWIEADTIPPPETGPPEFFRLRLNNGEVRDVNVAQRGRNSFVAVWTQVTPTGGTTNQYDVLFRTYDCENCPRESFGDASHWSPFQVIEQAINPRVVSGPSGTFITYQHAPDGGTFGTGFYTRRLTGTVLGSENPNVSVGVDRFPYDVIEDPAGRFFAALQERRAPPAPGRVWLAYHSSLDGVTWTDPPEYLDLDQTAEPVHPVVSGRCGDDGLTGAVFWNLRYPQGYNGDGSEPIMTAPIPHSGEAASDNGPCPAPVPDPGPDPGPGPGPDPGPGPGPPPPPVTDACKILQFGAIDAVADACLTRKDSVFTAKGTVRVNGMTIAAKEISFDIKQRIIESVGPATVKLGDTTLFKAPIDWELPKGNTVKLPSISTGDAGGKLNGFPLKGSIEPKLVRGAVEVAMHLGLPKIFGGVTGDVTVRADNLAGVHLRELHVKAGTSFLGPLEVQNLEFLYNPDEKRWAGGAKLGIPPRPPAPVLESHVGFVDGDLDFLRNELTFPGEGIPVDPFNSVHLTKVRFSLATRPDLKLSGGATFTAGPKIGSIRVAEIDGDMTFTFPDGRPAILRADGQVRLMSIPVANAYVQYRTDGLVNLGASVDLNAFDIFSLKATVDGWILLRTATFSIYGKARVCVGDLGCGDGEVELSSIGAAACGEIGPVDAGVGYKWDNALILTPAWLFAVDVMPTGCGVGDYTPAAPAAARAGAPRQVKVDAGLPSAVFRITGTDAPPHVTLVDPTGKRIEAPLDHSINTPELAVGHVLPKKLTIVAVKKPAAGNWKIEPADDSSPIASAAYANGLPEPAISAKVGGHGRKRVLSYKVKPIEGQKVTFEEHGADGTTGSIGTARGRKGKLRFSPARGAKGKRTIFARVQSFGTLRTQLRVASYIAPPPAKPAKPKGLKIKRKGTKLVISWKPVRGISRYRLRLSLTDGRTLIRLPKRKQRSITFRGVRKKVKATANLKGEFADGTTGPGATAKLRK